MQVKPLILSFGLLTAPAFLRAQLEFKVDGHAVQVHGFASQGFAYSDNNNYLTMKTSKGSFAMTDGGLNVSTQLTDRLRVGAQVYVRDIGNLGQWHPHLDWAFADYRVKDWFGIRGGKVKTALGLFNDTQDNDSLHTFALLPQAVYPIDLRDATIAHTGGDIYGNVGLKRSGSLAYTLYAGHRQDPKEGGYLYLLRDRGIFMTDYGGLQYGADLRWNTPLPGAVLGVSHMREEITGTGTASCSAGSPPVCPAWNAANNGQYEEHSKKDQTNLAYGEYAYGNFRFDAEYRRYWRNQLAFNGLWDVKADTRGWYLAAAYRLSRRFEVGSYYSRYTCMYQRGFLAPSYDISKPDNHLFDKVATLRVDLTRYWIVKLEGHFMDGVGSSQSPIGFYTPDNPGGFKPTTNLVLVRTGFSF